jgi:glycerol-3-phosphate dehydrogenase (NAD(P)+)
MKIALLGTGSFGTTMGVLLATNLINSKNQNFSGHRISCYVRDSRKAKHFTKKRFNPSYKELKDLIYPYNVIFSTSIEEVVKDASHIVFCYPSKYAPDILKSIKDYVSSKTKIISLVKGFHLEDNNFFTMSSLISNTLNINIENICSLGGPNTYLEIAQNLLSTNPQFKPCNIVISSKSIDTAKVFQEFYQTNNCIRSYTSDDIISAEVCGALKNVIAIACGVADGYTGSKGGLGINFKASLITRGMYEIAYLSRGIGGSFEKAFGVAGIGDTIATAFAGRSYRAGLDIAKGLTIEEVKNKYAPFEIEAFQTLLIINNFVNTINKHNQNIHLSMPIMKAIYDVIYNKQIITRAIADVINRDLKNEFRVDPYFAQILNTH